MQRDARGTRQDHGGVPRRRDHHRQEHPADRQRRNHPATLKASTKSGNHNHRLGPCRTELNAAKAARARANLAEAGLADLVTILEGDARETLADLPGLVGFVLLDGWKRLYLPVLRLLEPRLAPGALVVADDTVSMAAEMPDYLSYVRDPSRGYLSVSFPESDGLEITCRL